jgi:DNA-directed RNA polymerase subunit M/transcription elongation factor TFIIS
MKKFTLKANLLSGLSFTVNKLTPEQKGKDQADVIGANRMALKAVEDCETANNVFLSACKTTEDAKLACHKRLTEEMNTEKEGKTPEEAAKIMAEKSNIFKKEVEEIQSKSTANADESVDVELSDEKFETMKRLFPQTISQWTDSKLFVEVADALDAALEI